MSRGIGCDWPTIMTALQAWVVRASGLADANVVWMMGKGQRPVAPFISMNITDISSIAHDYTKTADNPLAFADVPVSLVDPALDQLTAAAHGLSTGDGPVHLPTTGVLGGNIPAGDVWLIRVDADHVALADTFLHALSGTRINITTAGTGSLAIRATADSLRVGQELKRTAKGIREVTLELQCFAPEGSDITAITLLADVVESIPLNVQPLTEAGIGVTDIGTTFNGGGVKFVEGKRGSIVEPRAVCEVTLYLATELHDYLGVIDSVQITAKIKNSAGTALADIPITAST
jgi:hypothetical protein